MEQNTELIVKFKLDLKVVRKCFVLMDEDIPSDEEIYQKMNDKLIDISNSKDSDTNDALMGFTLVAIGKTFQ